MVQPNFADYTKGLGAELMCPRCESFYLHQFKVEVFSRHEDSLAGKHTTVTNGVITVDGNMKDNPSERRQGSKISFICEDCKCVSYISFAQHKGLTLVDLIDTGESLENVFNT